VSQTLLNRGIATRAIVIGALLAIALFVLPATLGGDWITTLTSVSIYAVVAAGLVVLYGKVGMVSLGQIALLGVGTWVATRLNFLIDLPFPLLLLLTGLITCAVGVLIGLPALRLSGLYLALITLMGAGALTIILRTVEFPNGGPGFTGHGSAVDLSNLEQVRRPLGATDDTNFYRYVVVVCALMFVLALVHFITKPGRAWATIRESEPAALAAGVNVTLYKLWAFALASFMTGVAGALLAAQIGNPTVYGFPTQDSLTLTATALIGGIFTLWGAVVAGIFMQLVPFILQTQWSVDPNWLLVLFGIGLLQVLLTAPGGVAQQLPKDLANLARLVSRPFRKGSGSDDTSTRK
jgi:branched-chain amino acid transport system permease protein